MDHAHDERGRHALAGDVAHHDRDAAVNGAEDVVEVAAHLLGGPVDGRQTDGLPGLGSRREQLGLHLAGDLQLQLQASASHVSAKAEARGHDGREQGQRAAAVDGEVPADGPDDRGVSNDERRCDLHGYQRAPRGRGTRSRGRRREKDGQGGRVDGKDLHHGLAAGRRNDPIESLAAAEVGALLVAREQPCSRAPATRQHAAIRPPDLDPQRLVGRAVHRLRQLLERRRARCRRASQVLLESHHVLAQLLAHLLNGEEPRDEQVVADRVGEQEEGQNRAGDQPGRHPAIGPRDVTPAGLGRTRDESHVLSSLSTLRQDTRGWTAGREPKLHRLVDSTANRRERPALARATGDVRLPDGCDRRQRAVDRPRTSTVAFPPSR